MRIDIETVVSVLNEEPFVLVRVGKMEGRLTPSEARAHAMSILEAAEAAESDAALVAFLKKRVGLASQADYAAILQDFRKYREGRAITGK